MCRLVCGGAISWRFERAGQSLQHFEKGKAAQFMCPFDAVLDVGLGDVVFHFGNPFDLSVEDEYEGDDAISQTRLSFCSGKVY